MTALITGASSGLGWEFAKLFAKDGCDLILVARRTDKLNELKSELEKSYGIAVTVLSQDLTAKNAAKTVYDFTVKNKFAVDFLVNNAGFGDYGAFIGCNLEKQQNMIQLNVAALTELSYYFLPQMVERKAGRILNVASIASFMPGPMMSVYYSTKAYVRSFSEALSVEVKKAGVSVTALCPGPTTSEFWERSEADGSSIFKHMFFAKAENVARYGYKRMKRGKALAVPGIMTRLEVFFMRFLPRSFVRNVIYFVQK